MTDVRQGYVSTAVVAVVTPGGLTGCADVTQMAFRHDDQLQVTAPGSRELVELPAECTCPALSSSHPSPG